MGKLNIAHHKSYHPYRRDNIEKVRRDEEEARLKEAKEEGRMLLADSEARMDQLRQRAGIGSSSGSSKKRVRDDDLDKVIAEKSTSNRTALPTTGGHINFFEDLEQTSMAAAIRTATAKKTTPAETEKGVPLAPSAKDLKPWYTDREHDKIEDTADEKRKRDSARKSLHDPLTSINKQLSKSTPSSSGSTQNRRKGSTLMGPPEVNERLSRESSERERALALIRRKKREMAGSETPSTVHGGLDDDGVSDMFNRREVEAARRHRERRWEHRPWH